MLQTNTLTQGGGAITGNLSASIQKLTDDYNAGVQHQVKIDGDLTDTQKIQWESFKLHRVIDLRLAAAALTDDQTAKIKSLVDDTAKYHRGVDGQHDDSGR